jgi:FrmR/RcnR family transcriptional regulator, repressor of frmRAB operon
VAHTQRNKDKLLARIGRIRGQLNAAQVALEEQRECAEVLQVLAACRGALSSLVAEVIEDHVRFHVADPSDRPGTKRAQAIEQLIEVLRTYMR